MMEQNIDEKRDYLEQITQHIKEHNEKVSPEAIKKHISAHKNAIDELDDLIKKWCKNNGHQWISQGRVTRSYTYDVDIGAGFDRGTGTGEKYVWIRQCKVCDEEEAKDQTSQRIQLDPFTNQQFEYDNASYKKNGIKEHSEEDSCNY